MPSTAQHQGWLSTHWLPLAAAVLAACGGVVSMIGWIADIPRLLSWVNNDITIKFNAAVCIALAGFVLLIGVVIPRYRYTIRILSSIIVLIAGTTFLQHVTRLDLGIDTLVFDEAPAALATSSPGRMGPPAALSLTCIGLALMLTTTSPRGRRVAGWLAVVPLCVAVLSLNGYLFGANQLYSIPRFTGIAIQTASMIAILALGIIGSVREHGLAATFLREDAGGRMFRRLSFPIIAISLVLGMLRLYAQNAGYVDAAFGTASRTVIEILMLLGLLWWTAESLSRSEAIARESSNVKAENETLRRVAIAQESERRRIARDVHDHIGQSLTALRLKVDSLQKQTTADPEYSDAIAALSEHARKLDADVSLLVWQMRPGVLDTHGLASALNSFIREWSATHSIEAEFQTTSTDRRLSYEIETNLYRIIQEALNNTLKHAKATKVSVALNYLHDEAVIVVEDNGVGFDADADLIQTTEGSGFGLIGMRERAALIGGKLEIETVPGGGTAVLVRVPHLRPALSKAASGTSRS